MAENIQPSPASKMFSTGLALHRQGQLAQARDAYEQALRLEPSHFDSLHMLGVVAIQLGQFGYAIELIDEALRARPDNAHAYNARGTARQALGDLEGAIADIGRAAELAPAEASFHFNLGNAHKDAGNPTTALAHCDRALSLRPDYPEAHNNRGCLLERLERRQEALASYEMAIRCRPDYAEAYDNRGLVLADLGQFAAALESHRHALTLRPRFPDAHSNCGRLLAMMRRPAEALASCDAAIAQDPGHAAARFNKSIALLLAGDYGQGWPLYEWRLQLPEMGAHARRFAQPRWAGQETTLGGRTVLLHTEQGFGDTIQFCRYVELVSATGANVVLEVERPLLRLLRCLRGVSTMVEAGAPLPPFDYHCSLLSLPFAFGTTLDDIPRADEAYLCADPALAAAWRERLGPRQRPRVGLVWSGGVRAGRPDLWAMNERRNIPLKSMAAALQSRRVEFVSLQQGGPAEAEIRGREAEFWPAGNFRTHTNELEDFADTAALIDALDLVITVDTSTAHLGAAMGKPTWILSRHDGCWRWLLEREDSPWYRSARIYRQEADWDWDKVLRQVAADLERRFTESTGDRVR